MPSRSTAAVFAFLLSYLGLMHAADWPAFRGAAGDGISAETDAPLEWSREENIKWRAELRSPGNSSPIVSNGHVFVTATENKGKERSLLCFNRKDGNLLWTQTVQWDELMPTHKTNPHGSPTAVATKERVVVWHGSAGLFCYDLMGNELWSRNLGIFRHMWGYASSPIIHKNSVILNCGPGERVFLTAIDLNSGKTLWEQDEPVSGNGERGDKNQYVGSWSTPVVANVEGTPQIVCSFNTRVNGYDPTTGDILWSCAGLKGRKGELAYSSPHIAGDICVAIGGFGGPAIGFKMGGKGNITEMRMWRKEPNPQSIGSGVFVGEHLYLPDAAQGAIRCIDPNTGKDLWRERGSGPNHWGSIIVAAGRAYVTNQEGETVVFAPNPDKFELLGSNPLGERSNSTPAISDGEFFIRTHRALYCIADE